eukprot:scaffold309978_cov36-Prasinocladus_malaysianus.AAC.1
MSNYSYGYRTGTPYHSLWRHPVFVSILQLATKCTGTVLFFTESYRNVVATGYGYQWAGTSTLPIWGRAVRSAPHQPKRKQASRSRVRVATSDYRS